MRRHSLGLIAGLISASSVVAPTGFGSQASLFDIAFQGLAFAGVIAVAICGIGTSETRNGRRSNHGLPGHRHYALRAEVGLRYHPRLRSREGRVSMMILWDIQGHDGPANRAQ